MQCSMKEALEIKCDVKSCIRYHSRQLQLCSNIRVPFLRFACSEYAVMSCPFWSWMECIPKSENKLHVGCVVNFGNLLCDKDQMRHLHLIRKCIKAYCVRQYFTPGCPATRIIEKLSTF